MCLWVFYWKYEVRRRPKPFVAHSQVTARKLQNYEHQEIYMVDFAEAMIKPAKEFARAPNDLLSSVDSTTRIKTNAIPLVKQCTKYSRQAPFVALLDWRYMCLLEFAAHGTIYYPDRPRPLLIYPRGTISLSSRVGDILLHFQNKKVFSRRNSNG